MWLLLARVVGKEARVEEEGREDVSRRRKKTVGGGRNTKPGSRHKFILPYYYGMCNGRSLNKDA